MLATLVAWEAWDVAGEVDGFGLAMRPCSLRSVLRWAREQDPAALHNTLTALERRRRGKPFFQQSAGGPIGAVPAFGENTYNYTWRPLAPRRPLQSCGLPPCNVFIIVQGVKFLLTWKKVPMDAKAAPQNPQAPTRAGGLPRNCVM